jgi:UDP-glucuronate 4-epimerase
MKIVVTGAAGFIGSNLVKKLSEIGHSVLGIDALIDTTYSKELKHLRWLSLASIQNVKLQKIDMCTDGLEPLLDNSDLIFNLAAMPGLEDSWLNFDLYLSCNIAATQKLLEAISNINRKVRLIHISTSSVYGKFAVGDEETEKNPSSPYGVTKLAAENLIQAYASNASFDFNILRYFSVYGPGQRIDMAYSRFINAIYLGNTINVYGDGKQSRTNTYIDDCVNASIAVMENGRNRNIYNVSGVEEIDVLSSIEIIEDLMSKKAKINYMPSRFGDQQLTKGSINKLIDHTGFVPKIGIREGLKYQVEHYLSSI